MVKSFHKFLVVDLKLLVLAKFILHFSEISSIYYPFYSV